MRTLLTIEVVEVANGVLLTIERSAKISASDPFGDSGGGFKFGPHYYPSDIDAVAAIEPVIATREAREALSA